MASNVVQAMFDSSQCWSAVVQDDHALLGLRFCLPAMYEYALCLRALCACGVPPSLSLAIVCIWCSNYLLKHLSQAHQLAMILTKNQGKKTVRNTFQLQSYYNKTFTTGSGNSTPPWISVNNTWRKSSAAIKKTQANDALNTKLLIDYKY